AGGNALDQLTVTQSGGTTFASTVDAKSVTRTDRERTSDRDWSLDVCTCMPVSAGAGGDSVSITGGTNSIAGTTTFSNTGVVTIEIGRASCRERVEVAVAAVPLRKNIEDKVARTKGASENNLSTSAVTGR